MPRRMMFSYPVASGLSPTFVSNRDDTRPEQKTPLGRFENAGEHFQQGCLSRSVRADQRDPLAAYNLKAHLAQRADVDPFPGASAEISRVDEASSAFFRDRLPPW